MKLCEHENCKQRAYYGSVFNTPLFCKNHKKDKMKSRYAICRCGKSIPKFGFKNDIRPSYCSKCKKDEMDDLIHKKCICGKASPVFGLIEDDKPSCCKNCRTVNMIDIVNKKCKCGKFRALFGLIDDKTPTCCSECKTNEMSNIVSKKCKCGKVYPTFGLENDKIPTCCKECKTTVMINIKNKNNKCKCGKVTPLFGLKMDTIPTCCKDCKTIEMIDIINKRCLCGKSNPTFGLLTDNKRICCKECKTDVMIDIKNKKCFCGSSCATFGLDIGKATHCNKCRTKEMFDVISKKCKSNYLEEGKKFDCSISANKKYKGFCTRCYAYHFPNDPLTFQIRCKTKEIAVRDYINSQFVGFYHDKPLWISECECTHKRRVDHRKLIGNTLLCIETDENQHKYYNKENEKARNNDLMMIHGGKFIFIRFNPDKYKENKKNKNPSIATRLLKLQDEINKQIKRIENEENTELLEEIYMYYDN